MKMKLINNKEVIDKWIKENNILDYFDMKDLSFTLQEYEKGELLASPEFPLKNFLFLVDGIIQIYGILNDGSKTSVNLITKPALLGDVEYCGNSNSTFFVEALTTTTCLALPMDKYREQLYLDVKFLHTLLSSLVEKIRLYSNEDIETQTVEKRVLFYMENIFQNQELKGIEAATIQLRCSRRQLQRVLKKLCDEKRIIQTGKGKYKLNNATNTL